MKGDNLNPILFVVGIPIGALLGIVAQRIEKRYKGKSDALRGILLGLPFAVFALAVILVDIFL